MHDFFFGDYRAAAPAAHVEAGVDEPEEEEEAADGAEDDADDGAGGGAGVEVGVGGGDGDDGLAAEEGGEGFGERLEWRTSGGCWGCGCGGEEGAWVEDGY